MSSKPSRKITNLESRKKKDTQHPTAMIRKTPKGCRYLGGWEERGPILAISNQPVEAITTMTTSGGCQCHAPLPQKADFLNLSRRQIYSAGCSVVAFGGENAVSRPWSQQLTFFQGGWFGGDAPSSRCL
jgi:hypothetical protein